MYRWITTFLAIAVCAWLFIYPERLISWVFIWLLLLLVLFELWYFKGVLNIKDSNKNSYPSLGFALFFPTFIAAIVASMVYPLNGYFVTFIYSIIAAAVLSFFISTFVFKHWRKNVRHRDAVIGITLALVIYSFSGITFINCYYDKAKPVLVNVLVINKHISTGKTAGYIIIIDDWKDGGETRAISVDKAKYESVQAGESVGVYIHRGMLGIEWFYLK